MTELNIDLNECVRTIKDFPIKGVEFYDVNSIFENVDAWREMVGQMYAQLEDLDFDIIIAVESRGFLPASALSLALDKPFTMVRKKGKLPGEVYSYEYALEYGTDILEIQKTALKNGIKCLIIDDILATGGTAVATAKLINQSGGQVVAFSFMMELTGLGGREKIEKVAPMFTVLDFPA